MRRAEGLLRFVPCWLLLWCVSTLAVAAAPTSTPDWEFSGDSNGIKVWTRMIPGAPLKDFRGVMQRVHDDAVPVRAHGDEVLAAVQRQLPDLSRSQHLSRCAGKAVSRPAVENAAAHLRQRAVHDGAG